MGVKRDEPYSISTPDKGGLGGGGRMFRREKEKVGEDMGEGEEGHHERKSGREHNSY